MPDSNPPASGSDNGKTSVLKGWAAIIASIAALVTAIGALLKPPQEPAAKATYETLASAVKAQSEAIAKNHDDIVALRNYLEGYTKGAGVQPPAPTTSGPVGVPRPPPPTHPTIAPKPAPVAPPPPVGPRPTVWEPPDFSKVKK